MVLPMDIGEMIPANDSVRLLDALCERMDFRKLCAEYSREGRNETSPKALFKVVVYGDMTGNGATRKIEASCKRDVNFMFLLGREKAPDHSTIARFISQRLAPVMDEMMGQLVALFREYGEISGEQVFIDGTKIEANANRYTFVWKQSTQKNEGKMQAKMQGQLPALAGELGVRFDVGDTIKAKHLKKLRKKLYALKAAQNTAFVHGKGQRKTPLQRAIECVEDYIEKQKRYNDYNHSFGERNSFSKTDRDATFMRMKEDHMRNGQLKPGYNATIAVDSEYIVGAMISSDRSDSGTFIPMMEKLKPLGYAKPVADAGYESEENYTYCEKNHLTAFIKPSNHDRAKTKKYRSDIGKRENMPYDAERDCYICHMGHPIQADGEKQSRSKAGFPVVTTVYTCARCDGCPHKTKCIKGSSQTPLQERSKHLHVSKTFERQRQAMEARINTNEGILLRKNRSIQVEGAFGVIKQDMGFRRFVRRSQAKVQTEFLLICMAYNINKIHNKIQNCRCGTYLHIPLAA